MLWLILLDVIKHSDLIYCCWFPGSIVNLLIQAPCKATGTSTSSQYGMYNVFWCNTKWCTTCNSFVVGTSATFIFSDKTLLKQALWTNSSLFVVCCSLALTPCHLDRTNTHSRTLTVLEPCHFDRTNTLLLPLLACN